jgi:cytochrome c biogenesis protein CcdA/HEAT repeat protein
MKLVRLILVSCILGAAAARGQDGGPSDGAFDRFNHGTLDVATLSEVLPQLADPERRASIRTKILEAKSPPRRELVALLEHPMLAVRLGSLELLEEMAGGDFSFNPWLAGSDPGNLASIARWKAWSGEPPDAKPNGSIFSGEQRRSYLRDLLGDDPDKSSRARRMLEAEGLSAVGFLEAFLIQTPALPAIGRSRVREAQYQIVLARNFGDQAAVLARHLAFGSRDQLLSALGSVREAGRFGIPILRDFVSHPDPLVRETAIDTLLVSGGEPAVVMITPLLAKEPDVNVIHGVIRRLKDIKCKPSMDLVGGFINHPDEDLVVSAIQASLSLSGDQQSAFGSGAGKSNAVADEVIVRALDDSRWRVRAAALEYVALRKLSKAKDRCLVLLDDGDDFVRFAAVKALVAMNAKEALPKLKAMALKDDSMLAAAIEGYGEMEQSLDPDILTKIKAADPDVKLAAIRSIASNEKLALFALRFVEDSNNDVACAVLRSIAGNTERLNDNAFASALVKALRSGDPAKARAITENLSLPKSSSARLDPRLLEGLRMADRSREKTDLDPMYDAFVLPDVGNGAAKRADDEKPGIPGAKEALVEEIVRQVTGGKTPDERFPAALNLARADIDTGYACLLKDLPTYTTARKVMICDQLYSPSSGEALALMAELLRDPVSEVRREAVQCSMSNEDAKALIGQVIRELDREGSLLQPDECYSYRFDYAVRENIPLFRAWCAGVLDSKQSTAPKLVLAAVAARHCANGKLLDSLRALTASGNPLVRRAAWHSLISARSAELAAAAPRLAEDPEAFVREVLPDRSASTGHRWQHRFSDVQVADDQHSDYSGKKLRADESVRAILLRLADKDPSPMIRFEAMFALLDHGVAIDFDAFVSLVSKQSADDHAAHRITRWLSENASRATPALRPLLAVMSPDGMEPDKLKLLQSKIEPSGGKELLTFASLAEGQSKPSDKGTPVLAEEKAVPKAERKSLEVVFFHKPGCQECNKTRQYFEALRKDFPLVAVREVNILETSGTEFNQALCSRFNVPSARHTVAPAVFTQAGYLVGPDIAPLALGKLFADTMGLGQDDQWSVMARPEQVAAAKEVGRRYEAITLPIVIGGGLLDGINPCAFATIIFFLSYLQIARRTPREMLMVGASFILAVFLAYLAAGLVLHQVLETLSSKVAGVQRWMNLGFGGLALLASWLSLKDAWKARAGKLDEMTLQLPGLLKDRIRGVIRSGARARRFVVAAFLAGLVISLLELACTGQVYAPIIYQIQKGRLDAVLWLVIYNLAFITPLIVIFLLAYGGLRSETLIEFQKKHTFAVKLGLALLFLVLALFIFFGGRLLHG